MRRVVFSLAAAKTLRKLPDEARAQVRAKIDRYAESGAGDVKTLQGRIGFRLRVGDYRVLFHADEAVVDVQEVGHRRDIYR